MANIKIGIRRWWLLLALPVVFAVGIGWYLISPLFFDKTVDEAFTFEIKEPIKAEEATTEAPAEEGVADVSESKSETVSVAPLISGSFTGADAFHQGTGDATIYETEGNFVLRLENFEVTNGPDLRVYLAAGTGPTNRSDLGQFVDLGSLKGNIGNQNYDIPADVDVTLYNSVVIYCKPFHVVFATASFE
jgi:hypothetical protein